MTKIVADADGLIKLGKAGVLSGLLGAAELLVPVPVYEEAVIAGKRGMYEDAFALEEALREGGARIVAEPTEEERDEGVEALLEGPGAPSLGAGERSTLRVFIEYGADAILNDDWAFAKMLGREGLRVLLPTAAIVFMAEAGRIAVDEAVGALQKIEGLVRRDVYETAMEDLESTSGKDDER